MPPHMTSGYGSKNNPITCVPPHMTHEISPVSEALVTLRAGILPLVRQAGCPAAAARRKRRGQPALTAHVWNIHNFNKGGKGK